MQRSFSNQRKGSAQPDPGVLGATADSSAQVARLQREMLERMAEALRRDLRLVVFYTHYLERQSALKAAEERRD